MKIHILSNSLKVNSGFSNVARSLAEGLTKLGHEIQMTGMQTAYIPEYTYGIEVLPIEVFYVDEMTQFVLNVRRQNADVVFCIFQADADLNPFAKAFKKTVWYVPVEVTGINIEMRNDLKSIIKEGGVIVAQTEFGKREMERAGIGTVPVIYHGYNPDIFKPMNLKSSKGKDKNNLRYCYYATDAAKIFSNPVKLCERNCYCCGLSINEQTVCPSYTKEDITILRFDDKKWAEKNITIDHLPKESEGKFIFGFVGQNFMVRKRIERLIVAYAIFVNNSKMNRDRTMLHLHTMPISIRGLNLIDLVMKFGIQDNVIFSYGRGRSSTWSDQAMNVLYNTFDCNVSASSGEGFGLPIIESMACGIPNIGPNFSSFIELLGYNLKYSPKFSISNTTGLLANLSSIQMIQDGSYRAIVSEEDLAEKMDVMFKDKKLRDVFSVNAIKFAKSYTWDDICILWNGIFKDMV